MNIYVGNLAYKVSDNDLKNAFEEFGGVISAKVITDRDTGRSKGFGFVEMENDNEAQKAIDALDGTEMDGRSIKVNKAKPKPSGNKGGGYSKKKY